jgi:hypothetical protein
MRRSAIDGPINFDTPSDLSRRRICRVCELALLIELEAYREKRGDPDAGLAISVDQKDDSRKAFSVFFREHNQCR